MRVLTTEETHIPTGGISPQAAAAAAVVATWAAEKILDKVADMWNQAVEKDREEMKKNGLEPSQTKSPEEVNKQPGFSVVGGLKIEVQHVQ